MRTNAILMILATIAGAGVGCGDDDAAPATTSEIKAPSNLDAAPLDRAAHLTWKDNSDDEAKFVIERKTGSADWKAVGSVTFDTTQYHDADLEPATKYVYRVMAMPKVGTKGAYSNEATCTTPGGGDSAGGMDGHSSHAGSSAGMAAGQGGKGGSGATSAGAGGAGDSHAGASGMDHGDHAGAGASAAGHGGAGGAAAGHGGNSSAGSSAGGGQGGDSAGAGGHDGHH